MTFDLHITIQDNSPAAHAVQNVAASHHITPEEAAMRLLTEAARTYGKKTPADELIGAFSSTEDSAIIDAAMASAKAHRAEFDRVREFGF